MIGTVVDTTTMDISIFDAFPNAIISGVFQVGTCKHGTVVGNEFKKLADIDVRVDEGNSSSINTTPESINSDLLVYVRPCEVFNVSTNKLVSDYMLYDTQDNYYYQIVDAGIGKNQHTGNIEHIELKLVQTEVADV